MKLNIIIILILLPFVLFAEETKVLSLDDAVKTAMEKNKNVEQAKEYNKYLYGVYVEERSAALPSASFYTTVARNDDPSTGAAVKSDTFNSYSAGFKLKQALFTWGQVGAAIKVAEIGLKTGDEQLRMYRQAVTRDVTVAFTDILLTKKLLYIAQENVDQKQRHYDEAQKKYKLGTATDYDVLSAKVALENAMPDVITYKNNLRVGKDNLRYILSVDYDIDVQGELTPDYKQVDDFDTLMKTADANRPELLDQRLSVDVYKELIKVNGAGDKPRLDLTGSFDRTKLEADKQYIGNSWNVGVTMSYAFFDGMKTKGKVIQSESDMRRAKLKELQIKDSVALDVRQAISRVQQSEEIIQASRATVEEAQKLLDMAEKGYVYGVKTKLDVDDAQFNLRSSEVRLAQAYRDYKVQYANLLWSLGIIGEKEL